MSRASLLLSLLPVVALSQGTRTTAEVRASVDRLSGGRPSWQEHTIELRRYTSMRNQAGIAFGWLQRFGVTDQRVQGDLSFAMGSRFTLAAEGEHSPTHHVIARYGGAVRLHGSLGAGWGVEGRVTARQYDPARVRAASAALERYWSSLHATWIVSATQVDDVNPAMAHTARMTRYWGTRGSFTVSASTGREVENIDGVIMVLDARSVGTWAVAPVARHVDVVFAGGFNQHRGLFSRTHGALGLRIGG